MEYNITINKILAMVYFDCSSNNNVLIKFIR